MDNFCLKGDFIDVELDNLNKKRDNIVAEFCKKYSIPLNDFELLEISLYKIDNEYSTIELNRLYEARVALLGLGVKNGSDNG